MFHGIVGPWFFTHLSLPCALRLLDNLFTEVRASVCHMTNAHCSVFIKGAKVIYRFGLVFVHHWGQARGEYEPDHHRASLGHVIESLSDPEMLVRQAYRRKCVPCSNNNCSFISLNEDSPGLLC